MGRVIGAPFRPCFWTKGQSIVYVYDSPEKNHLIFCWLFVIFRNKKLKDWTMEWPVMFSLVLKIHFGVWWFWTLVSDRKNGFLQSIFGWFPLQDDVLVKKQNDSVLQACACQQMLELLEFVYAVQTLELYQQTTSFLQAKLFIRFWMFAAKPERFLSRQNTMGSHWTQPWSVDDWKAKWKPLDLMDNDD